MPSEATSERPESPAEEPLDWKGTDRFEVVRRIGRGGMGTVYEARDRERRQRVALKTLLHFNPAALYLFKQEFRTLAGVTHPNLVRLYELVATETDRVFFAMELVRGVDFLSYVYKPGSVSASVPAPGQPLESGSMPTRSDRNACPADLDRLRPALRQLVEGVQALHFARKLHRDIKPSNVLVTPEGRVVLLDFGVATELPRIADESLREEGEVVGTARYMAPEQAFDEASTPAADWYSVGVILYEALVGAPPFSGSTDEVLRSKVLSDPVPPSDRMDGVPHDLQELCLALLEREPGRRPGGADLLRRLGGSRGSLPPRSTFPDPMGGVSLVGREAAMRALEEAFEVSRGGRCVTVRVRGRSGMGKSTLLQHFLDDRVKKGDAVVLQGRAYERESVPYKAFDSVVDALSRHLMHVNDLEGTLVKPRDTWALARLFPVLRRVPSIGESGEEPVIDPQRVRRRAFGALRELFLTLASRRPLIVYVDDAQWGDTDSAALLLDLVRPPFAPPVMFILAHREEDALTAPFLTELRARWPEGADLRDVVVGPLDRDDASRLSLALLGSNDDSARRFADAVASESGGSPFLVEELTRSAAGRKLSADDARVTLEQMVADRLAALPDDARRLAEIVAVGGRPIPLSTVAEAADIASTDDVIALLAKRRFARPGLRDGREVVEPVHDRLRETVVAQLKESTLQEHHARLARALEASLDADPESVALHLIGAGEADRGALFAERAAERAATQLAFGQAARLFRLAIETLPAQSPELRSLRSRLGEVLGWAGHSEEAGRAYLAAADGAPPLERLDLERLGSEHLLAAGRVEEGALVLRRVLSNAGVDAPASPLGAIFWLILYKLWLKIRGLGFEERGAEKVSPEDRVRLAALNVAALLLASVDNLLAACMQARQLVLALRRGDRSQVLRAAVIYANHLATRGGPVQHHERSLSAIIDRLAIGSDSPLDIAYARGTGGVGFFLRGRWRDAVETIDEAYANTPNLVAGVQAQASLYAVYALVFLGDLAGVRVRQTRMLVDADQRDDLFTAVQLRVSHPTVLLLAADDPAGARRQTREAAALWTHSKFLIQDWQVMRSEAEIELYAGDGGRAYERIEKDQVALKKSLLLTVQFMRALTAFVRGRAALASIESDSRLRSVRLGEARKLSAQLERERMPWTAPLAAILAASAASVEGDVAQAVAALRRAADLAKAADMSLYAAAARYQLGRLLGGTEGKRLVESSDDVMVTQEVRAPARFATMLVPGRWGESAK